jgi:hypothetical protein
MLNRKKNRGIMRKKWWTYRNIVLIVRAVFAKSCGKETTGKSSVVRRRDLHCKSGEISPDEITGEVQPSNGFSEDR